jgi:hypothetical protein
LHIWGNKSRFFSPGLLIFRIDVFIADERFQ